MGILDWISDLSTLKDSENNISNENYQNSPTELMYPNEITVYVYEGEGTGIDGGGGVNYYTDGYSTNLQNGSYVLPINKEATFSSGATGDIFDPWEDKWVDIYYGPLHVAHVHIGNNTPDAVMNYSINLSDIINFINSANNSVIDPNEFPYPDFQYPDYSEFNYYAGQGTYNPWGNFYTYYTEWDNEKGGFIDYGEWYDPYYTPKEILDERKQDYLYWKEFEEDKLPIGGNWANWGDAIYNWFDNFADKYVSWEPANWGIKFLGGVASGLVGGTAGLIYGTGWAVGKTLATGDTGYLKWWGTQVAEGFAQTLTIPVKGIVEGASPREWGEFASLFVGLKGAKVGWKGISKVGDWYRTRNLPKLSAESYIHPKAMDASKPTFPPAKSFEELKKSFEDAGNKVITFTPDEIVGNIVGDSRKGALGLEDSGIYVAPKGKGNPYFTRKTDYSFSWKDILKEAKKGIEFKWNLFENIKEKWQKYGKTGRVYETQVKGVVRPPDDVLKQPGFSAVNEWGQKNLVGTGYIRFTKRSLLGQGEIPRQKMKVWWKDGEAVPPGTPGAKLKEIWEPGTKEFEALIDKGYKFVDEGPVGYIEWGGRRIIVNKFTLLDRQGRKIGTGFMDENGKAIVKGISPDEKIMSYEEFARKIKEDSKPYYEDKYTINLDSSIHYIKPDYSLNYNIQKNTFYNNLNSNSDSSDKYSKNDDNYSYNPKNNDNYPKFPDYDINKYTKNNYFKTDYSDYTPKNSYNIADKYTPNLNKYTDNYSPNPDKYTPTPSTYTPNPSTYTPTPTIYSPNPPTYPPVTPTVIPPPTYPPTKDTYTYRKQNTGKKKISKELSKAFAIPKVFPQGAAKTKRDWYVIDLDKAFKDVEKLLKSFKF